MEQWTFVKASSINATAGRYGAKSPRRKRGRPNVLLLLSDQHYTSVMGCASHSLVKTPNLDRLASEGIRFTREHCPDGICCSTEKTIRSK
ncbi:MAG: sulfatase-like hydrolase/transferase [Planctomycetota bacterium]|jgi:choline-sulfatase